MRGNLFILIAGIMASGYQAPPPIVLKKSFKGNGGIWMPTRSQRIKNKLNRKYYK